MESSSGTPLRVRIAIAAMVGCVVLSLVQLVNLVLPTWASTYVVIGCILVSFEASYSMVIIHERRLLPRQDRLRFRVAEILLVLILMKLASYIGQPLKAVIRDWVAISRTPLDLLSVESFAVWMLAMLSWSATTLTLRDFERMRLRPRDRGTERSPAETMTGRFFAGGMLLLFTAGLARFEIGSFLGFNHSPVRGLTALVLVYFLIGLAMLGHVQSLRLREQWKSQQVRVDSEVARRWATYSLIAIGLAAAVSFILPTSYSAGILQVAAIAIDFVLRVILFLTRQLLIVVGFLFWALSALLALLLGNKDVPPAPTESAPGQLPEYIRPSPEWLAPIRTVLFWMIAAGVIFYVVKTYLRDHPNPLRGATLRKLLAAARAFFVRLWRRGSDMRRAVRDALPRLFRMVSRIGLRDERFLDLSRLRGLSRRERIQAYYLSTVQRAARSGAPRQPAQTPYEYEKTLDASIPDAAQPLTDLTQAFIIARYSRRSVSRTDVQQARSLWRALRTALRSLRSGHPGDNKREEQV
ncbi:MAG: DUF4129 domain-containing protein [Anaerolineae bacterium]|nr:DUF4129 domain-containing protein [Anaerolineae bacterium]